MDGVQRGLADVFWDYGRSGFDDGQEEPRSDSGWGCRNPELTNLTPGREGRQIVIVELGEPIGIDDAALS
jgi:hypothetical protein